MRVLALTRYSERGATSRVRFLQYLPALRERGIEVAVAPLSDDRYIENIQTGRRQPRSRIVLDYLRRLAGLAAARRFDLLWIEKELFPMAPPWAELLLRLRLPYAVDYDDATFHGYDLHRRPLVRRLLGDKVDRVMRGAALVVAGNAYLAERARASGARRVEILPSVVDLERYSPAPARCGGPLTIGWIGSATTTRYLERIAGPLASLCAGGGCRVLAVGAVGLRLPGVPLETRAWSLEREVADLHDIDVGVMPLEDNPWARGKCGYKLVQYMACALPQVASPVGVNRSIVSDGETGFWATTDEDWRDRLGRLRDDRALALRLGQAARRRVESRYSLQVTAPLLADLLLSAARR